MADKVDEAEQAARLMLELAPDNQQAYGLLATCRIARGQFAEALPFSERSYTLAPHLPHSIGTFAGLLARNGDLSHAEALLQELGPPETYGVPRALAYFHAAKGDVDQAADWWERAIRQRDLAVPLMSRSPLLKPLLASSHWPKLAALMNLPA